MINRRRILTVGSAACLSTAFAGRQLGGRLVAATLGVGSATVGPGGLAHAQSLQSGKLKITTFTDGHLSLPVSRITPDAPKAERTAALKAAGQQGDMYASPLNVTLIETPTEKILVDVGAGPYFMASAGKLAESLESGGVDLEAITKVVFTHAHPDHLWGTINDFDEENFPNATYLIAEAEYNFWMSADVLSQLPKARHSFAAGAQRTLKTIKERLNTIKPGAEIAAGVRTVATPGHTPGHIALEAGAGSEAVMILGDALTNAVISFKHHDWRAPMDQDPDQAVTTRARLLDQLATDGHRLIGYHLPAPGLGRVAREGKRFRLVPL